MPEDLKIKFIEEIGDPNIFFKKIITIAVGNSVSDIHVTPYENGGYVKFRRAGKLIIFCRITKDAHTKMVNIIHTNSGIDRQNDTTPQDGKLNMRILLGERETSVNLRISSLLSMYGDNIVIRLLPADKSKLDVSKLGFREKNVGLLKEIKNLRNGLVLAAGSTGSGKTTTLYSFLGMFDPLKKAIYTIEDPIEYQVDGYIQSQLPNNLTPAQYELTLSKWLKGLLRQNPDIILVGELREKQSASICLEAANTGNLVFATIHANNALSIITRLKQLGIAQYLIAGGLKYVIYQKLVKKLCPHCHVKRDMSDHEIFSKDINRILNKVLGGDYLDLTLSMANHKGCDKCENGYSGLTIITEVIKVDDVMAQMIFEDKSTQEMRKYLQKEGFNTVFEDALIKSLDGEVDLTEVVLLGTDQSNQ